MVLFFLSEAENLLSNIRICFSFNLSISLFFCISRTFFESTPIFYVNYLYVNRFSVFHFLSFDLTFNPIQKMEKQKENMIWFYYSRISFLYIKIVRSGAACYRAGKAYLGWRLLLQKIWKWNSAVTVTQIIKIYKTLVNFEKYINKKGDFFKRYYVEVRGLKKFVITT